MSLSYAVAGGRAVRILAGDKMEPASVDQDWPAWEGVFADIPFDLGGVARLFFEISETSAGASVSLSFQNESGRYQGPPELGVGWDHFVFESTLIPIRRWELESAFEVMRECGVQIGLPISLASLFRLMVRAREAGIPIYAPHEFEALSKFEPKAGHLEGFLATPYPYQSIGIDWLTDYYDNSLGMMLCDEMGLGKTVQAIGLIAHALNVGAQNILIVAPASVVPNWKRELAKFLPDTDWVEHLGPSRAATLQQILEQKCMITSYETLVRDAELFGAGNFDLVVADEAQAVKNFTSKRHFALSKLTSRSKLLMTGTPLENRLVELVSLVEIVAPGLLGAPEKFQTLIDDDPELARDIGSQASPLILRRRVLEVAKDLPELIEIPTPIRPTRAWAQSYNRELLAPSSLLAKYTKLTQICCNPSLVDYGFVDPEPDAKLARLWDILDEVRDLGDEKVIIFSTYLESISLLERFLGRHFDAEVIRRLDGSVGPQDRQLVVEDFNKADGFAVMVINPTAGGVGLNITGANHVIHFNRQWNPALEAQATARAYRRGQTKPVRVHKFFYEGTIEEEIHTRLISKLRLADAALAGAEELSRTSAEPVTENQRELIDSLKPIQEG